MKWPSFLSCVLLSTLVGPLTCARAQSGGGSESIAPFSSDAAVRAIDRFVAAFNSRDLRALNAAFTPPAAAYLGDSQGGFEKIEWLDSPWQYHQLMAHQLTHDGKGWVVDEKSSAALIVVERVVSGTFLAQKERLLYPDPSGGSAALEQMVTYQVRNGRIHRLWIYPWVSDKRSPEIQNPTYPAGNGPKVYFDTWHGNVSTPEGAFSSFADLLRRDGYQVRPWEGEFSAAALRDVDVLIISNAMPHEEGDPMSSVRHDTMNVGASFPPAFTGQEEAAVSDWVAAGGALLLIADHDPYPSTAKSLAARFGAEFHNGRVFDSEKKGGGGDLFSRVDGTLRPHAITDGSETGHVVNSVKTYLGQAFPVTPDIDPLLVLRESMVLKGATDNGKPDEIEVAGWLQAGVREFGQGRVALFGEAWMFRELNDPRTQNPRFILNLMSWLSASSPDESPSRSQ